MCDSHDLLYFLTSKLEFLLRKLRWYSCASKWIHARPNWVVQLRIANANSFFGMFERKIIFVLKKNPEAYMSLVLEIGQFEVHFASNCQKYLVFLSYPWYFVVDMYYKCTMKYHRYDKKTKDFWQFEAKWTSNWPISKTKDM